MPFLAFAFNALVGGFTIARIVAKFKMTLVLALFKQARFFGCYNSVNDFDFPRNCLHSFF